MSIYNNTIKSMIEYRTLSGHLSALGKIMASTEDGHLYRLIQDAGSSLQYQLQHRIGRQIPISLMAGPGPQIVQLYEYCMQQKQSKKAECLMHFSFAM